jgi:hypothetical protein
MAWQAKVGALSQNTFNSNYLTHIRNVQNEIGMTMGEHPGFSSDDSQTFAPNITTEGPPPFRRNHAMPTMRYQAMVPTTPFYKGETSSQMTVPVLSNSPEQLNGSVDLSTKSTAVALLISLFAVVLLSNT